MATPVGDSYAVASGGVIAAGRFYGTAATSLTFTDTTYQRLYQRVGTSKSITVAGSSNGTRIQARACPVGTGLTQDEVLYPFINLTTSHPGGAFSLPLVVPQGDFWVVQIRDGINHALGQTGTHEFGVGAFIALLGQSNMEQMFDDTINYPLGAPGTYSTKNGFVRIGNINPAYPPGTPASVYNSAGTHYHETGFRSGDGLVYAANRMREGLGCPIGILDFAASGSWISLWTSGGAQNTEFLAGLSAIGGDFEAALWLQGETDAQNGTSEAAYKTSLTSLFNQLKTVTGRSTLDFGVVIVGPATAAWTPTEGRMAAMRKAQIDFVAENAAGGAFIAGTDIDGDLGNGSSIHITPSSRTVQGRRYGECIVRRLTGAAYGIEGPVISSASRSGAVVTVNITQQGGTSLKDGAGGSGSALLGFRVFDGGTPCTISSTLISGNAVVLTLSATPSGVVTMDYAMANAPFGSATVASTVCYDDQTIPGSAVGLPLLPKPLFTVS